MNSTMDESGPSMGASSSGTHLSLDFIEAQRLWNQRGTVIDY